MKLGKFVVPDFYVLIAGLVLLVGGVIGFLFMVKSTNDAEAVPPTNALTQTAQYDQSLVVPAKQTPTPEVIKHFDTSTPAPQHEIETLNVDKYFVHASAASGLENPMIPDRIVIPAISLDAPVVIADYNTTNVDGETFGQWEAPNKLAAGWHPDSALLGQIGNTVINGHHNEFGEVFGRLVDLQVGDKVYVFSKGHKFAFVITNRMILQERFVDMATRLSNARWLNRSDDIRLTLITCWPKISNTHRLILVATPIIE